MPDYVVTDADGRQLRFSGPAPPTQAVIAQGFAKLPPAPTGWRKAVDELINQGVGLVRGLTVGTSDPGDVVGAKLGTLAMAAAPLAGPMKAASAAGTAEEAAQGITAYHGSPYDFEKFDVSKIGTGEGAQAYGHGLYFAENPNTAQAYRDKLSPPPEVTVAGQKVPLAASAFDKQSPEQIVAGRLAHYTRSMRSLGHQPTTEGTLSLVRNDIENGLRFAIQRNDTPVIQSLTAQKAAFEQMVQQGIDVGTAGKTYQVSIAAHPDAFLDWDKPLSEQSEYVKQALARVPSKYGLPEAEGNVLYQSLAHDLQGETMKPGMKHLPIVDAKAQVSERLKAAGISGIKYLDQGSRAAGEGSRNFVVFDDSLVSIMKKYGIALPFFAGMSRLAKRHAAD